MRFATSPGPQITWSKTSFAVKRPVTRLGTIDSTAGEPRFLCSTRRPDQNLIFERGERPPSAKYRLGLS